MWSLKKSCTIYFLPFRVLEKNICGADNHKLWIRKPILHFQTNHVTKNQSYCNMIFLVFRFFCFLCEIIIIRNCFGVQKSLLANDLSDVPLRASYLGAYNPNFERDPLGTYTLTKWSSPQLGSAVNRYGKAQKGT